MTFSRFIPLLFLYCQVASAAFEYPATSAAIAGLASSNVAGSRSSLTFLINPAHSSNQHSVSASINYYNLFNLQELSYANAMAAFGIAKFSGGLAIENFGNTIYRENRVTLNVSGPFFADNLIFGVSVNSYFISVQNYRNTSALGLDVGFRYQISSLVGVGATIQNINQPTLNGRREELPQNFRVGAEYTPLPDLRAYVALEKDAYFDPGFSLGVEYQPNSLVTFVSGYNSIAPSPAVGVGFKLGSFQINYAFQYHFQLSVTHFFGISFSKK